MSGKEPGPPVLKVDIDGVTMLPKKRQPVKWDDSVLDNDVRDSIRETEALARADEEEVEYELESSDDEELDDPEHQLSHKIIMGYLKILNEYGFSDPFKLQRLDPPEWEDLAANVGILPEHEKHLMAALGIKRKRVKMVRRFVFIFFISWHLRSILSVRHLYYPSHYYSDPFSSLLIFLPAESEGPDFFEKIRDWSDVGEGLLERQRRGGRRG